VAVTVAAVTDTTGLLMGERVFLKSKRHANAATITTIAEYTVVRVLYDMTGRLEIAGNEINFDIHSTSFRERA
jgi:hypothetical protein